MVGAWFSFLILFLCPADIDECLTVGICPAYSNCLNSVGSYKCTCRVDRITEIDSLAAEVKVDLSSYRFSNTQDLPEFDSPCL